MDLLCFSATKASSRSYSSLSDFSSSEDMSSLTEKAANVGASAAAANAYKIEEDDESDGVVW